MGNWACYVDINCQSFYFIFSIIISWAYKFLKLFNVPFVSCYLRLLLPLFWVTTIWERIRIYIKWILLAAYEMTMGHGPLLYGLDLMVQIVCVLPLDPRG